MTRSTRLSVEALDDRCLPSFVSAGQYTFDTLPGNFTNEFPSLTADFNNDGLADLFAVEGRGMENVGVVYLGQQDGTFVEWQTLNAEFARLIGVGDYDNDGYLDLMVYSAYDNGFDPVDVYRNDGIWPNTPQLSITGASVTEGNSGTVAAVFAVTLENGPDQPVTINYATSDLSATAGSDYQATSGTLTFEPGETTKAITVLVNGDRLGEGNEYFFVNLSDSANASLVHGQGMGTILDDEPAVYITDTSATEGNTGARSASFTVALSFAYDVPVTVSYATADDTATAGTDFQTAGGTLTFAPGETSKTITALVNGDRLPEPNETFSVNLSGPTNASIADGQGVGTILDDEPRISIGNVSMKEGNGKKTTAFTFTVTLSAAYDQPVTVSFQTVNDTATTGDGDYVAKSGTLTFASGETTKTITIVVNGDNKREANETFYLDLFGLSNYALFTKNRGVGTILNDD